MNRQLEIESGLRAAADTFHHYFALLLQTTGDGWPDSMPECIRAVLRFNDPEWTPRQHLTDLTIQWGRAAFRQADVLVRYFG